MRDQLFIIGNGFDLAHGLKSSFSHFLADYTEKIVSTIRLKDRFDDENIIITPGRYGQRFALKSTNLKDLKEELLQDYSMIINDPILSEIINKKDTNWSDFEYTFYELLRKYVNGDVLNRINSLNSSLDRFSKSFQDYLVNESEKSELKPIHGFQKLFANAPEKSLILDFNYTNLISKHYTEAKNLIYIPIHGELNYSNTDKKLNENPNPIVLGYGDDYHEDYLKWLSKNDKSILKHLKSYAYYRTPHYKSLLMWINGAHNQIHRQINFPYEFDVRIIGHSCGLSDRTLLREIFQDEKCKDIYIYYHDSMDNFTDITYNISRHFEKSVDAREKIINFNSEYKCPQWDD